MNQPVTGLTSEEIRELKRYVAALFVAESYAMKGGEAENNEYLSRRNLVRGIFARVSTDYVAVPMQSARKIIVDYWADNCRCIACDGHAALIPGARMDSLQHRDGCWVAQIEFTDPSAHSG